MQPTTGFLVAVLSAVATAGVIVACLWRPLLAILSDMCGTESRARFWRSYTSILLVLVPLAAVLLGRSSERPAEAVVFLVADQLRWALIGLIAALAIIAMTLTSFLSRCPPGPLERTIQAGELNRLQALVDEMRRAGPPVSP